MSLTLKPLVTASLALLLAACGQTGALYLPDESQQIVVREREATSPAPSSSPTPSSTPAPSNPSAPSDAPAPPPN
jgi:predicted small lipoprotein YifL